MKNLAGLLKPIAETDGHIDTPLTISCLNSFVHDDEDFCVEELATTRSFPNEATSTINFCAEFFELPRFDEFKRKSPDEIRVQYHDDEYHGTDGK